MAEALLYDKLDDQRVRCNVCLWRCLINPGKVRRLRGEAATITGR